MSNSRNCRYRYWSITLFTAVFLSIMLINPTHYYNMTYQEEPQTTTTSYEQRRDQHMKSVIAYSRERQLQMVKSDIKVCPEYLKVPLQSKLNIRNQYWQQLIDGVYFYSAYFDNRIEQHHFIRVLGMVRQDFKPTSLYCQLWYDNATLAVEGRIIDVWLPHWDPNALKNTSKPVILSCEIPQDKIPFGVTINNEVCSNTHTFLPINNSLYHTKDPRLRANSKVQSKSKGQFALCVKGLDFTSDISSRLIEWLELNILLGADKFFIYVYTIHDKVRRVLEYYASKGFVNIKDISLPPPQPNDPLGRSTFLRQELWQKRRNEIIPYNDCYYRNLYSSRFVIPIDIDEVILPVKDRTWRKLIERIENTNSGIFEKFSSLSVRNTYFLGVYPKDNVMQGLHALTHLMRSEFSPGEDAVKSFISTSNALAVFNHFTLRTLSTDVRRNVILDTGLVRLNHYRHDCDSRLVEDCDNIRRQYKRDTIMLKYKYELVNKVRNAREEIALF